MAHNKSDKSGKTHDLTEGSILGKLLAVGIPLMGTQFLQMAYSLTDMFWLGRVGSNAVAASGIAALYIWLSVGFFLLGSVGAAIGVSQSIGGGDKAGAVAFSQNALLINACSGLLCGLAFIIFARPLASFFPIGNDDVLRDATAYLRIAGVGLLPSFISAVIGGSFNASGNARPPFIINAIGIVANLILDPVLIFLCGLGIAGAALATIASQFLVCALLLVALKKAKGRPFPAFSFRFRPDAAKIRLIVKWAAPGSIESIAMCFLVMLTSRIEASFGPEVMAASKVSSQIESLSWFIGGGFTSALVVFVGQNFGAGKQERIRRGVKISALVMGGWGAVVTIIMLTVGAYIFGFFLPDSSAIAIGRRYLFIFAFCQIPMNLDAAWAGAFKGVGRTLPPAVVSIVCNCLKPLAAFVLSQTSLGVYGVWIGGSALNSVRGLWIMIWYLRENSFRKR